MVVLTVRWNSIRSPISSSFISSSTRAHRVWSRPGNNKPALFGNIPTSYQPGSFSLIFVTTMETAAEAGPANSTLRDAETTDLQFYGIFRFQLDIVICRTKALDTTYVNKDVFFRWWFSERQNFAKLFYFFLITHHLKTKNTK